MRRPFITGLLAAALLLTGFSAGASAQNYPDPIAPQPTAAPGAVAPPSPTPFGGLGTAFADSTGPSADAVPTAAPTAEATATDTDAPQLAFTGGESDVLAYVGSGMIAVGAIALVARRRLDQD